jgi:hypothetical protein
MSIWSERDLPILRALLEAPDPYLRDCYLTIGGCGRGAEALGIALSDAEVSDDARAR